MTGIFSAVGDVLESIMGNEVLAVFVIGIPLFAIAVGVMRKFIRRR